LNATGAQATIFACHEMSLFGTQNIHARTVAEPTMRALQVGLKHRAQRSDRIISSWIFQPCPPAQNMQERPVRALIQSIKFGIHFELQSHD